MASGANFILEIRSRGFAVASLWNDVPVDANPSGTERICQLKLNPWVVEGENEARAVIRPADVPAAKGKQPGQPYFSVRVLRAHHGDVDAATLATFEWESGQGSPPRAWRETVRVGDAFGRWSWESAPRIPVGATDRQAIVSVLNRVRDALLSADRMIVAELFRLRNAEFARALDLPPEEVESDMMAFFEPFFAAPDRVLEPVFDGGLQFHSQAQGRLVAVSTIEGLPPIRAAGGNSRLQVPITLTRDARQWSIAR